MGLVRFLENMTEMVYLTLVDNSVTNIKPLLKMQKMQWLTLEVGEYLNLDKLMNVLPSLKALKTVALHNCSFTENEMKMLQDKMSDREIRFNGYGAL